MANNSIKFTELPVLTTPNGNTAVMARHVGNSGTSNTYQLPLSSIATGIVVSGPYANDSAAATANVAVLHLYYDTNGHVRIRLT
jgi:hypothetical protein